MSWEVGAGIAARTGRMDGGTEIEGTGVGCGVM